MMKLFDKKSVVKIAEDDLKDAKLSSIDFAAEGTKKRAFIDVLGARLAMKLLFSKKVEATNLYSLYTIHNVLEEIDIADIYFKGIKIDVRLVFNKNEIFVPKPHFEYGLLPDLYVVLGLEDDLSSAELLGFFEPKSIDKNNQNKDFYFFEYENLSKPDKIKKFLDEFIPENVSEMSEEDFSKTEELFLSLVDKEISPKDKLFLLKQLAGNISLREKMVEFENFEIISRTAAKNDVLLQDGLLDIVGAQKLFENQEGKDFQDEVEIQIGNEAETEDEFEFESEENTDDGNEQDFQIIEDEINELLENKENESNDKSQSDSKIIESGLDVVAAGLELGGAVAAGAAGIALAENAITSGITEIAAAGIGLGEELLKNSVGQLPSEKPEIQEEDLSEVNFMNEDENNVELNDEIDNTDKLLSQSEKLPELNVGEEFFDIDENYIPEFKPEDDFLSENQDVLSDLNLQETEDETTEEKLSDFGSEEQDFNEIVKIEEDLSSDVVERENDEIAEPEKIEPVVLEPIISTDIEDFSIITDSLEQPLEELPQLEEFEEKSSTENSLPENEKSEEKVFDLDNFDFKMLDENPNPEEQKPIETTDNLVSFDSMMEKPKKEQIIESDELETLEKIRALEAEEEKAEKAQKNMDEENVNKNDDLISQVDEFLKDIELSDEQRDFLENTLISNEETASLTANSELIQEPANLPEEEIFAHQPEENEDDDKDLLKVLFKNEQIEEIPEINFEEKRVPLKLTKNKKMIIAASIASVVLASLIIGGAAIQNKNANNLNDPNAQIAANSNPNPAFPQDGNMNIDPSQQIPNNPAAQQALPGESLQGLTSSDMGKAMADAFLSEPVNASISKIAWEVPEDLAYNDSFRKYLQMAGKNLKLNLQNDLLLATEMAYSNKVVVDLEINKDGTLQSENVATSSGSKQIDKIVLQSVKETLKYLKLPASELSGGSAPATLIINF